MEPISTLVAQDRAVTARKPQEPAQSGAIRLHRARKGPIATALAKSIEDARQADRIPDHSVVVAIAERLAVVADAAWRADNVGVFMSSTSKLTALVGRLGLELELVPEPAGGGDGGDDDGHGDAIDRELGAILGSGPALRDSPNSRA